MATYKIIVKGLLMCCYFDIYFPLKNNTPKRIVRIECPVSTYKREIVFFVTIRVWCQKKSLCKYGVP